MNVAIGNLALPKPTRKVKKLIDRSAKKLAYEFSRILKKEDRKAKKEESLRNSHVQKGKKNKKQKKAELKSLETA